MIASASSEKRSRRRSTIVLLRVISGGGGELMYLPRQSVLSLLSGERFYKGRLRASSISSLLSHPHTRPTYFHSTFAHYITTAFTMFTTKRTPSTLSAIAPRKVSAELGARIRKVVGASFHYLSRRNGTHHMHGLSTAIFRPDRRQAPKATVREPSPDPELLHGAFTSDCESIGSSTSASLELDEERLESVGSWFAGDEESSYSVNFWPTTRSEYGEVAHVGGCGEELVIRRVQSYASYHVVVGHIERPARRSGYLTAEVV